MTRETLLRRVLAFIDSDGDSETFETLAVDIHRYQHANDAVVRAQIDAPASSLAQIPAIPVGLFRDLDVGTVDPAAPHVWFHTSGTTTGRSGIHRMWDTCAYDRGCMRWAAPFLPSTTQTIALMPDNPHSSLAHMIRGFADHTGPVTFVMEDIPALVSAVRQPVFLCTTAFALDHWLEHDPEPLPAGSAIFVTGGFKGRQHERDPDRLIADARRRAPVVLEYGMTELSSQLWAHPGEPYAPPPWLRVVTVNPLTGIPVGPGELGQLRFVDLCNLDSTVCIETLDQGVVDAQGRVTLHGRLPAARLRGCSLTAEELLR